MISNSFHNICFQKEPSGIKGKNSQPVSQIVISKPQKQLSNKLFNAAMFGLGLGVGDSIYSNYAQRRDIKRALNEYKNSPYSQKKLAIQKGADLLDIKNPTEDMILEALKYNPTSYELHYNLGIAYTMLNDFQSAKICYEKAAEINSLAYNAKF